MDIGSLFGLAVILAGIAFIIYKVQAKARARTAAAAKEIADSFKAPVAVEPVAEAPVADAPKARVRKTTRKTTARKSR